jgi:hypothetical protein
MTTSPIPKEAGTIPVPNPEFVQEEELTQDHTSTEPTQDTIPKESPQQAAPSVNITMDILQSLIQRLRNTEPSRATLHKQRDTKVPDPKHFASKSIKEFKK